MKAYQFAAASAASIILGGLGLVATATAGLLSHTLGVEVLFPNKGNSFCCIASVVATSGVELNPGALATFAPDGSLNVSDFQIEFARTGRGDYVGPPAFPSFTFNGLHYFDVQKDIPDIIDVTIDAVTDLPGFNANRVTFSADDIFLNLGGLNAPGAHRVVLDVTLADAVAPEPSALALFGVGFGLLACFRHRSTT